MNCEACLLSVPIGRVIGTLAVLFLISILYAILLAISEKRWGFVSSYTWLTVVIGVSYTLIAVAVLDLRAAGLALLTFAVSSLPIIGQAIAEDLAERNELRHHLEELGNRDPT